MSFAIRRMELLEIVGSNKCAAELITLFKNWYRKAHRPLKVTQEQLGEKLGYCRDTIGKATRILNELGIVTRQRNPRDRQSQTWRYIFHGDRLNQLLSALNAENQSQSAEESSPNVEKSASNIEYDPVSRSSFLDPPTFPAAGFFEKGEEILEEDFSLTTQELEEEEEYFSQDDKTPHVDHFSVPPADEEIEKVSLVRDAGLLTPQIKRLVQALTLAEIKQALQLLSQRQEQDKSKPVEKRIRDARGWFYNCLDQRWFVTPEAPKPVAIPQQINAPDAKAIALLDEAKAARKIHDYFLSSDGITKVVLPNMRQLPWWEALKV